MEIIRHHGKKQCSIKLIRHLWLYLLCGLMVGELADTLNKDVVMLHYGDLELWVKNAVILTSVDLNIFTEILSKTAVQLWSQACLTEIRDPDTIWLNP